jgi:adenylate cyclase
VRVTAQRIEAESGEHLWADRYDGELVYIFSLQDEISRTIVSTIAGRLEDRDADRAAARPLTDLDAYEQVLRGQKFLHRYSREDYALARECFVRALEIDPTFARAHGYLALVEAYDWFWEGGPDLLSRAIETGERGLMLDPHDAKCHLALGLAYLFSKSHDKAGLHFSRCTELNPNDDLAMVEYGRYLMYIGKPGEGAEFVRRAMRRNPFHPNWYWNILGRCLHMLGDYQSAIGAFGNLTTIQIWTVAYLVGCHANLGHAHEAAEFVKKTLALEPGFSLANFAKTFPYRDPKDLNRFIEGLRLGGLPD